MLKDNTNFTIDPKKTVIVFDFDGTLVDTLKSVQEIVGAVSKKFGLGNLIGIDGDSINDNQANKFLRFRGIKQLITPLIVAEVKRKQAEQIGDMKLFPGLKKVIENFGRSGYRMGIVTSNSTDNVNAFLKIHRMSNWFGFVNSGGLYSKDNTLKQILKTERIAAKDVVYVGDEVRDIEAARSAEVKVVSVSWGYQSKEILAKAQPDRLATNPSELEALFIKLGWWEQILNRLKTIGFGK